jgi:hypothetical protein
LFTPFKARIQVVHIVEFRIWLSLQDLSRIRIRLTTIEDHIKMQ